MKNLDNFKMESYLNDDRTTPSATQTPRTEREELPFAATEREQIHAVANQLISSGIDITQGYQNWINLGFALKDALGEEGRQLFHDLSRLNPGYNATECDKKYSSIMRSQGDGVHIATLFHLAKDAGVNIGEVAREFCATSAIPPTGRNMEKRVKINNSDILDKNTPSGGMAEVAQSTFSDQLRREDIPSFLHPVWDSQATAAGRDKMLLGVLNMVSGLMPDAIYGIYDRRKVYAAMYNIVFGGYATLKGELEVVKLIAAPVKQEMRARYEAQKNEYEQALADWETQGKKERGPRPQAPALCSPFVSANSSASAVYRGMDANGGFGIMFETEADTLTNMLSKSEYGDYSDLLRKAHHHETISMVRVSDQINIEIEKPRLSVFLTCTGSQLPQLLPANNVANGLASRFLFYALPDSKLEFRNVFDGCDDPIEDVYRDMGNRFLPLYHELLRRGERLRQLQFVMSMAQQEEFVQSFDAVLREQFAMLGDGIQGFIFRLALECYRYAMVLTVLRRLSDWDGRDTIFDDDEQALVCDDLDFHTAMVIVNCLVNHTGRVYAVLATQDKDPFSKATEQPSEELRRFYDALPLGEFKAATALKVSKNLSISGRTAQRLLGDMVTKFLVLQHPRQGVYVKGLTDSTAVSSAQTDSSDPLNSIVNNPKQHSYDNDR